MQFSFRKNFMCALTWYAQHEPQNKSVNIASCGATQQGVGLHHAGIPAGESLRAIQHPLKNQPKRALASLMLLARQKIATVSQLERAREQQFSREGNMELWGSCFWMG